jgi:hypothetical protein
LLPKQILLRLRRVQILYIFAAFGSMLFLCIDKCQYGLVSSYDPIDIGVPLQASRSDLVAFKWTTNGIIADFILPDDNAHFLRVSFDKQCIVRLLDEMALSTESDDSPNEGLVSEHFAYRLEGSAFARLQSKAWMFGLSLTHYQFVTGMACMDVLSSAEPIFAQVPR